MRADLLGGGFPLVALHDELRALGRTPMMPPSAEASSADVVLKLWKDAGLEAIETREIEVSRTFANFEEYWATALLSPSTGSFIATLEAGEIAGFKKRLSARLPADAAGRITYSARANAVKGMKPK